MTATEPEAQHRSRVAKAIWGYSGLTQRELAAKAGMHIDRLRVIVATNPRKGATLDELRDLARVAGVPDLFALEGFAALADSARVARGVAELQRRVAALEAQRMPPRIEQLVIQEVARILRAERQPRKPRSEDGPDRREEAG